MRLTDQITAEGRRLFQLRSAVPVVLLPALYFALLQMAQFQQRWGNRALDLWLALCIGVSALGLLMRSLTVGFVPAGTSGRGQGTPSASTLNTLGMYSIVRSPLYLANGVMWLGVALATSSGWFVIVSVLVYWLYIERVIAAEEAFLDGHFGDTFRTWARSTPCFLPRPSLWRASAMRFSFRTVLRREHSGLIAVGVMAPLLKFICNTLIEGEPPARWIDTDRPWVILIAVSLFIGLSLKMMKKRHWLDAAGR